MTATCPMCRACDSRWQRTCREAGLGSQACVGAAWARGSLFWPIPVRLCSPPEKQPAKMSARAIPAAWMGSHKAVAGSAFSLCCTLIWQAFTTKISCKALAFVKPKWFRARSVSCRELPSPAPHPSMASHMLGLLVWFSSGTLIRPLVSRASAGSRTGAGHPARARTGGPGSWRWPLPGLQRGDVLCSPEASWCLENPFELEEEFNLCQD